MMKKYQKWISRVLVFLLVLSLLPASALTALADAAYTVLVEPSYDYHYIGAGSGDVAAVWQAVYKEPSTGRYLSKAEVDRMGEQWRERVLLYYEHFLIGIDGNSFKQISDIYTDMSGPYADGLYIARKDGVYGIINAKNELISDFKYSWISSISDDGYAVATLPESYETVVVDLNTGAVKTQTQRGSIISGYAYGMMPDRSRNQYRYIDLDGEVVLPGPYVRANKFQNGYAIVEIEDNVVQVIDTTGNVIFSDADKDYSIVWNAYSDLYVSKDGYVIYSSDDEYGLVSIFNGNMIKAGSSLNYIQKNFQDGYAVIGYKAVDGSGTTLDLDGLTCITVSDTGTAWVRNWDGALGAVKLPIPTIPETTETLTLPNAVRYVPYSYSPEGHADSIYTLAEGTLPAGLTLGLDGTISGMATELGVFDFVVTENYSGGRVRHNYTLSVIYQGAVDVETYNEPGYGFVETETDDGRVQDQFVSSVAELTDQTMHSEGAFSEFRALYIDAQRLARDVDYTAEEGSTKITIKDETFEEFGSGTHTIAAEFVTNSGENTQLKYTVQNYTITGIPGTNITVVLEGEPIIWWDAEPYIDGNWRTMTPFRIIGEALGLTAGWDGSTREAYFSDGNRTIYFPIDSTTARTSEGGTVQMDTSAVILNGRTFAPVRYLAEYFGHTVDWDGNTRTVTIR